jgi:hypothetical protein
LAAQPAIDFAREKVEAVDVKAAGDEEVAALFRNADRVAEQADRGHIDPGLPGETVEWAMAVRTCEAIAAAAVSPGKPGAI